MLRNNKTEVKTRFTLGLVVLSSVRSASDLSTTSEWKPWGYVKVLQPCVHVGFSSVRLLSDFWPGDKDNKVINLYSFKLLWKFVTAAVKKWIHYVRTLFFFFSFFKFYFYFILLYNTVLVLPYIDMNPLLYRNSVAVHISTSNVREMVLPF